MSTLASTTFPAMPNPVQSNRLLRSRGRMLREKLIESVLFLAALISVLTTAGILYVLLKESYSFFQHVSIKRHDLADIGYRYPFQSGRLRL